MDRCTAEYYVPLPGQHVPRLMAEESPLECPEIVDKQNINRCSLRIDHSGNHIWEPAYAHLLLEFENLPSGWSTTPEIWGQVERWILDGRPGRKA